MQRILNISQNELFYPLGVQFGVYFNCSLLSPHTSLTPGHRHIHHKHKAATPPQLKLKKKTKFKSTPSHFLRYTSTN